MDEIEQPWSPRKELEERAQSAFRYAEEHEERAAELRKEADEIEQRAIAARERARRLRNACAHLSGKDV